MNSIKFLSLSFFVISLSKNLNCDVKSSKINFSKTKDQNNKIVSNKDESSKQKIRSIKDKAVDLIKRRMISLKQKNKILKKKAIINADLENLFKKSLNFARIERTLKDLEESMQEKQRQLLSLRDDTSMSNSDKEVKMQEIYISSRSILNRKQEILQNIQKTMENITNTLLNTLVQFYDIAFQSSSSMRYNEKYFENKFDDYTDEYKELLECELEKIK